MSTSDGGLWSPITPPNQLPRGPAFNSVQREPRNDLDRHAFLQLLITQMQHQDPLNPMDDRDFMAQMAQFSALEQMINLNTSFQQSQAFTMIGRTAEFGMFHPITGEWLEDTGLVTAVNRRGSEVFLAVETRNGIIDVPVDAVRSVGEDFFMSHQLDTIMRDMHMTRMQDLVGRHIQAEIMDASGNVTDYVEGRVDQIRFGPNGQAILIVGNREVFFHEVRAVSDSYFLFGPSSKALTNGWVLNEDGEVINRTEIQNVRVNSGRAYLVFGNGQEVHVSRINQVTEALAYINRPITHLSVSGTVRSIEIRTGVPWFNVYEPYGTGERQVGQISYVQYLADRLAAEA